MPWECYQGQTLLRAEVPAPAKVILYGPGTFSFVGLGSTSGSREPGDNDEKFATNWRLDWQEMAFIV